MDKFKPAYLEFIRTTALRTGQYEELEKRLKYTPFDDKEFKWLLVYDGSPWFFVLRDALRRGGYHFELCASDPSERDLNFTSILTPWSYSRGPQHVRIRGENRPRSEMGLYYEAGDWDCPQQNFLCDWEEAHVWAYLLHRNLVHLDLGT
jgi:hypothetical protein